MTVVLSHNPLVDPSRTAPVTGTDDCDRQDADESESVPFDVDRLHETLSALGRPVTTAAELARRLDRSQAATDDALRELADRGAVEQFDAAEDPVVWYPADWASMVDRERVVVFPARREVVVDRPEQYTRARLSTFARLLDVTAEGASRYEIRPEDIWATPHRTLDELVTTVRRALDGRYEELEEWIEDQWNRARAFTLRTHEDGYVVLEAERAELMGNVAREHLDESQLRAPISDTEAWIAEEALAEVKRTLYDAGYPIRDERDLDEGDPLDFTIGLDLRGYQRDWVERVLESGSGVLVGPAGSGKTITALAVAAEIGGETLVLVPGRELAEQWREAALTNTSLVDEQVGVYHGGRKELRSVTIATYRIASMDRHRLLFEDRRWGLIVYDEVHRVPADVNRRTASLQGRHRLGLSASPVREDGREEEVFALIGPPIGTDWEALFEAGHVAEPTVEIRYVPWDDEAHEAYGDAVGRSRRQLAATNPAKVEEIRRLLARHRDATALVFVEYLDQGAHVADELGVPFVSGETPHPERERRFDALRRGELDALVVSRVADEGIDIPDTEVAIVASGLGGSRRQGTQRAGRTMRPEGRSLVYVLATRGTDEESFARRQMRHLAGKGVRVRETNAAGE